MMFFILHLLKEELKFMIRNLNFSANFDKILEL